MPVINSPESSLIKDLTENEKQYGIDLKLNNDGDLEFNNFNDIKLIAGGANVAQAIKLKLFTEPGGLLHHPIIGTNLLIGEKVVKAIDIKSQIIRSLLVDPRIEDIQVKVQIDGGTILVDLTVTLLNTNLAIPLQFTVDRG